jgi:hypothetical protein
MGFAAATLFGRPGELVRPYPTAVKERAPVGSHFVAGGSWRASSYSVVEWALIAACGGAQVTALAMLIYIITFVENAPVGLGLALKQGLDWRGLRRIGRETSA